jgi:hypothetical protein
MPKASGTAWLEAKLKDLKASPRALWALGICVGGAVLLEVGRIWRARSHAKLRKGECKPGRKPLVQRNWLSCCRVVSYSWCHVVQTNVPSH